MTWRFKIRLSKADALGHRTANLFDASETEESINPPAEYEWYQDFTGLDIVAGSMRVFVNLPAGSYDLTYDIISGTGVVEITDAGGSEYANAFTLDNPTEVIIEFTGSNTQFRNIFLSADWQSVGIASIDKNVVVTRSIAPAQPKTDTSSVMGMHGVLDYTEIDGVYYDNRQITVKVREVYRSLAISRFKQAYSGQNVQICFSDDPEYYYEGRLTMTADNHAESFRTFAFSLDANPFKYLMSGVTSTPLTVRAYGLNYFTVDRETVTHSANCEPRWADDNSNFWMEIDTLDEYTWVDVPITLSAGTYGFRCNYHRGYPVVFNSDLSVDLGLEFTLEQSDTIHIRFFATSELNPIFSNFTLYGVTYQYIVNRGASVFPELSAPARQDIEFRVNNEQPVFIRYGQTWSPYLKLPYGINRVAAYAPTAESDTLTYKEAFL